MEFSREMRKVFIGVALSSAVFIVLWLGCADFKEPGEPAAAHTEVWLSRSSPDNHGVKVAEIGMVSCTECHGSDYRGMENNGNSCYQCHKGPGGHFSSWMDTTSTRFHGLAALSRGKTACAICHGDDFQGGVSDVSCYKCHNGPSGHPKGWLDDDSPDFHGTKVHNEGVTECRTCHGEDLKGGIAGVACSKCHG